MQNFTSHEIESDQINERFLRMSFRNLFLDHCALDVDKATWLAITFDLLKVTPFVKLLILLYGPLDTAGNVNWHFASNVRSFEEDTCSYKSLAKAVAILRLVPNWTAATSLEILVYLSSNIQSLSMISFRKVTSFSLELFDYFIKQIIRPAGCCVLLQLFYCL